MLYFADDTDNREGRNLANRVSWDDAVAPG
jgi:hypothetical protein